MKYQRQISVHQVIIALLFLLLLPCCRTGRRQGGRQHVQRNTVSTEVVTHSDSLSLVRQLQTISAQKVRIEHIAFSPPDSLKKQYIQSVTRLVSDGQTIHTNSISGNDVQQTIISRQRSEVEEKVRSTNPFSYKLLAGLFLVVLVFVLLKLRR